MHFSPLIDELIEAFCCLPGVGRKTAQRFVLHILDKNRDNGKHLAITLQTAIEKIKHCDRCRTLSEEPLCMICRNNNRDPEQLCVVETPVDMLAIEQSGQFSGKYFVLMGRLSPLDGLGPSDIGLDKFEQLLQEEQPDEVIIATNPTVEGEATAHYLADLVNQRQIKATRLAHGVPVGGELEYIDENTLARALLSREVLA